jgi:hypothetical protein
MKVSTRKINNDDKFAKNYLNAVCKFTIEDSILKTHFKMLAKMSKCFSLNPQIKKYEGYITEGDFSKFEELLLKINKVKAATAKKSHERSKANAKKRTAKINCEHEDLGSLGYKHGETVTCPNCGQLAEVW